jgi:hypothetical protein
MLNLNIMLDALNQRTRLIVGICLALAGGILWSVQEGNTSYLIYGPWIALAQVMILSGGLLIFPSVVYFVGK